jgi:hypothetical protein
MRLRALQLLEGRGRLILSSQSPAIVKIKAMHWLHYSPFGNATARCM